MLEIAHTYKEYEKLRPSIAQDCKDLEKALYDENLYPWDEFEVEKIYYLLHGRRISDVKLLHADRWLRKAATSNPAAQRVLKLWKDQEKQVFFPEIGEESFELLAFRLLQWQRTSSLIIAAWKAVQQEGNPLEVVSIQLYLDITTASWEEVAAEGVVFI